MLSREEIDKCLSLHEQSLKSKNWSELPTHYSPHFIATLCSMALLALEAEKLVEALRKYDNIWDCSIRTDGFFIKRHCDEKWFHSSVWARPALKAHEARKRELGL